MHPFFYKKLKENLALWSLSLLHSIRIIVAIKEEYLRNIIFFDLNKILSSELDNGNASEVFLIFADRSRIIAGLISGNSNKIKKALRELTIDAKRKISRLSSVKNYVSYLEEKSVDDDVLEYIDAFKTATCATF